MRPSLPLGGGGGVCFGIPLKSSSTCSTVSQSCRKAASADAARGSERNRLYNSAIRSPIARRRGVLSDIAELYANTALKHQLQINHIQPPLELVADFFENRDALKA